MKYINENEIVKSSFVGTRNAQGITTYLIASLCEACSASQLVLDDELYVKEEFGLVVQGDITPVFNAAYFLRLPIAKKL